MNELLLLLALFVVLFLTQFLSSRLRQPLRTHIRLVSAILLLILVWGFADEGAKPIYKLGLTALAIISMVQSGINYRQLYTGSDQKD